MSRARVPLGLVDVEWDAQAIAHSQYARTLMARPEHVLALLDGLTIPFDPTVALAASVAPAPSVAPASAADTAEVNALTNARAAPRASSSMQLSLSDD